MAALQKEKGVPLVYIGLLSRAITCCQSVHGCVLLTKSFCYHRRKKVTDLTMKGSEKYVDDGMKM